MQIYDGKNDTKAFPTKHTIAIVSVNRIVCGENDNMTIRKNGREDWSLFYCEAGRIYFEKHILEAGQVWIYAPKVPQKYTIYSQDKTIYRYLHFTGSDMAELLSSLGVVPSTAIKIRSNSISDIFQNIQNSLIGDNMVAALNAESHALFLLSKIANTGKQLPDINMMKLVTDNMEHSFSIDYNPIYYADMLKISVSRFNHLFKECIGMSPYTYYTNLRITNACNLLEDTNFKIKDIAEKSGYKDALYFAQAFKKTIGLTPSEYRKAHKSIK